MMRKQYLLSGVWLVCFLVISGSLKAQQDPLYSQYMFNGSIINPAYPSMDEVASITAVVRNQWMGLRGAPKTLSFAFQTPVKETGLSIGAMGYLDKVGNYGENTGAFNVSQKIKLSTDKYIALGLRLGMSYFKEDNSEFQPTADPVFQQNMTYTKTDVGFGLMYFTPRFFAGVGAPNFRRIKLVNDQQYTITSEAHVYFQTGYLFDIGNELKLKPSALVKYVQSGPFQVDLNTNLLIKELLWIGASWRSSGSAVGLLQVQLTNALQIGYSYDYAYGKMIWSGMQSSHEVMINYRFPGWGNKTVSPRFF